MPRIHVRVTCKRNDTSVMTVMTLPIAIRSNDYRKCLARQCDAKIDDSSRPYFRPRAPPPSRTERALVTTRVKNTFVSARETARDVVTRSVWMCSRPITVDVRRTMVGRANHTSDIVLRERYGGFGKTPTMTNSNAVSISSRHTRELWRTTTIHVPGSRVS